MIDPEDQGQTPDMFAPAPGQILLHRPVEARTAFMSTPRSITCEHISLICDRPIPALCGAIRALGLPDSALQVVARDGAAVCFVQSIHEAARAGERAP